MSMMEAANAATATRLTPAQLRKQAEQLLADARAAEKAAAKGDIHAAVTDVSSGVSSVVTSARTDWREILDEISRLGGAGLATLGATGTLPHPLNIPAIASGVALVIARVLKLKL